jgi:hypothetical protein
MDCHVKLTKISKPALDSMWSERCAQGRQIFRFSGDDGNVDRFALFAAPGKSKV